MNQVENKVPVVTILGNAAYLAKNFERVENGWTAYKIFNSSYEAPAHWKIEAGSIITDNELDTDPDETCSSGINVAKDVMWIADFISTEDEDYHGRTSADVWKVFIPDTATIVIPEDTDGKIRANQIQLLSIVAEVHYRGYEDDWSDDEDAWPEDEYEDEDNFLFDDDDDDDDDF